MADQPQQTTTAKTVIPGYSEWLIAVSKRVTIRAGQFQTAFGAESGTVGRNDSNSAVIRLGGILRNDNFLAGIAEVAGTKLFPIA